MGLGQSKSEVSSSGQWNKPIPLESIYVSNAELRGNLFLRLCSAINLVSGFAGGSAAAFHLVLLAFENWDKAVFDYIIVRIYGVILGLVIVLQEMEYPSFFRHFAALESWVGRGLFLVFNAALIGCLEEYRFSPVMNSDLFLTCKTAVNIMLYCCGLLYIVLGLLCIRSLKMRELTTIRKKKQAAMQASQLKLHKDEIENLLRETENRLQGV